MAKYRPREWKRKGKTTEYLPILCPIPNQRRIRLLGRLDLESLAHQFVAFDDPDPDCYIYDGMRRDSIQPHWHSISALGIIGARGDNGIGVAIFLPLILRVCRRLTKRVLRSL